MVKRHIGGVSYERKSPPNQIFRSKMDELIDVYLQCFNIDQACHLVGLRPSHHARWYNEYSYYRQKFDEAAEIISEATKGNLPSQHLPEVKPIRKDDIAVPHGHTQSKADRQRLFLNAYANCGSVAAAAEAVGLTRWCHAKWLQRDEKYRELFVASKEAWVENLERYAIQRATTGVLKAARFKGELVGLDRSVSDNLLMFLLRGSAPEKYRESSGTTVNVQKNTALFPERSDEEKRARFLEVLGNMGITVNPPPPQIDEQAAESESD